MKTLFASGVGWVGLGSNNALRPFCEVSRRSYALSLKIKFRDDVSHEWMVISYMQIHFNFTPRGIRFFSHVARL